MDIGEGQFPDLVRGKAKYLHGIQIPSWGSKYLHGDPNAHNISYAPSKTDIFESDSGIFESDSGISVDKFPEIRSLQRVSVGR